MDQSQIDALLRQGIAAAKAGQTEQARQILLRVVELDETNVQGWLWLSSVVVDPAEKFTCLHNVLTLDPDNRPAQLGLARLDQQSPFPNLQTPDTDSLPAISVGEPATSLHDGAEESPATSTRRVSRYKRLSPRLSPQKSSVSTSAEQFDDNAVEGPEASRSQSSINTTDTDIAGHLKY